MSIYAGAHRMRIGCASDERSGHKNSATMTATTATAMTTTTVSFGML
jgi:hypothetical protein